MRSRTAGDRGRIRQSPGCRDGEWSVRAARRSVRRGIRHGGGRNTHGHERGSRIGSDRDDGSGGDCGGPDLDRLADHVGRSVVRRHHDHPAACPPSGDHRIARDPHDHCRRPGTGSDTDRAEPATDVRTRDLDPNPDPGGGARHPAVRGWVGERGDRWHGGEWSCGSIVTSGGDLSVADGGRDALMWNPDDGCSGRWDDDHRCRRHRGCRRSQRLVPVTARSERPVWVAARPLRRRRPHHRRPAACRRTRYGPRRQRCRMTARPVCAC